MSDLIKNAVIDNTKSNNKVATVTMPFTKDNYSVTYDGKYVATVKKGKKAVTAADALYIVEAQESLYYVEDDPEIQEAPEFIYTTIKTIDSAGKYTILLFNDKGLLTKEINETYTSSYFLKEPVNYRNRCINRINTVLKKAVALVAEVKFADGTLKTFEAVNNWVLSVDNE